MGGVPTLAFLKKYKLGLDKIPIPCYNQSTKRERKIPNTRKVTIMKTIVSIDEIDTSITSMKTAMAGLKDMFGIDLEKVKEVPENDASLEYKGYTAENLRGLIDYISDLHKALDFVEERIDNARYDMEHAIEE